VISMGSVTNSRWGDGTSGECDEREGDSLTCYTHTHTHTPREGKRELHIAFPLPSDTPKRDWIRTSEVRRTENVLPHATVGTEKMETSTKVSCMINFICE
jgi:hypothetical protein